MDWLKDFLNKNPIVTLGTPSLLAGLNFFGNLAIDLSDGHLDNQEFHQLMTSSSGVETIILVIIMIALKVKNK